MNGCVVERLRLYVQLARLDKPIGILLLLWPTLWGLWWAAGGWPSFKLIVIFVLGTVLMRSAGCVINDYADRDFDRHVERTVNRPLTSGKVTTREALLLAAERKFRPILMSCVAALFGMLPMATGTGLGSELRASIGIGSVGTSPLPILVTTFSTSG